ncbi:MAG: septum formation protein Maf [Oscillospiraceae bacterium]|nr:septum formation protein Maf [Oscillospiraceae bacterium]
MDIYLASTSPRRRQLMAEITPGFIRISPMAEEKEYPAFTPKEKAVRRSKDKCIAAINMLKNTDAVIISSDTVVDLDGETLDKPVDQADAYRIISALSQHFHYVHTAVTVYFEGSLFTFCDTTQVHFKHIPDEVIREYVKTDIPYDKRGRYGIQTPFGQEYIDKIDGDYYTVVGLPVKKLKKLLKFLNIV